MQRQQFGCHGPFRDKEDWEILLNDTSSHGIDLDYPGIRQLNNLTIGFIQEDKFEI